MLSFYLHPVLYTTLTSAGSNSEFSEVKKRGEKCFVHLGSLLKKALVELISRRGCAISCTCASLDIPAGKLRETYVTRVPRSLITQSLSQMTNTNGCTPRR